MTEKYDYQRFKPHEIARSFPETAETLLLNTYLTDEAAASARVFRVYRETPPHYHAGSDEYLYVLSGKGTFWMGDASNGGEFAPGDLLFFKRRIVHALPKILEDPVVFPSFDTPRRDPRTFSSSILRTPPRRALSDEKNNDICTLSSFRALDACHGVNGGVPMNPIDRIEVAARSDHRMGNGVAVADTGMPNFAAETLPNAFKVMCIDLDCNAVTRVYPGGVPGKLCASEKDKKLA